MRPFRSALCLLLLLAAGLLAQPAGQAEKLRRARELAAAGKVEDAIRIYEELVQAAPNNPVLITNLAIVEYKAGRYEDAIRHSQAALKLQPDLLAANLFLGASYIELQEPARAVEPLSKVVEAQPNERNARLMLAGAMLSLERFEEAAAHYQKAAELSPDNAKVWYGLGQSYESLSRRALVELQKNAPESPYRPALEAEFHLKQRRYGTAFQYFRQALARKPELRGLNAGLAAVYKETGHSDWAAAAEERERSLPPPDCSSSRLECDFMTGRYRELLESAKALNSPESQYWTSKAYGELARQSYARLTQLPPSVESHELAAKTYEDRGRFPEAVEEWRQALKLSPNDRRIKSRLALALYHSRDHKAALSLLEELLKQDPQSAELNFLYGASLLNMEQPEKAVPFLQSALERDPRFLSARAALGQAYLRLGKAAEAIPHLEAALPVDDDGSRRFQLVRAYQAAGRPDMAKRALAGYREFVKSAEEKRKFEEGAEITGP